MISVRQPRRRSAQSIIEVLIGALILIPLVLFILDLAVMVIANSTNDNLAKNAARAAANQQTKALAEEAAKKAVESLKPSAIITAARLDQVEYVPDERVSVRTQINVSLPVPFPGLDSKPIFQAQATEPVVTVSQE